MPIHAPRICSSEHVDEIKMARKTETFVGHVEENVDFEESTPLFGMHTTRMQNYQKDRGGKLNIV